MHSPSSTSGRVSLLSYLKTRQTAALTRKERMEVRRNELEKLYAEWEYDILSQVIPLCDADLRMSDEELKAIGNLIDRASRCTYSHMRDSMTMDIVVIIRSFP